MTSFLDGPAKGKSLMLKRVCTFLRVTEENGEFDALDQPNDTPKPTEKLYAYLLAEHKGNMHIKCGGKAKSASGFYPISEYRLCAIQPPQDVLADQTAWFEWCTQQPLPGCAPKAPA